MTSSYSLTSAGTADRTTLGVTNPWVAPSTAAKATMRSMAEGVLVPNEKGEKKARTKKCEAKYGGTQMLKR